MLDSLQPDLPKSIRRYIALASLTRQYLDLFVDGYTLHTDGIKRQRFCTPCQTMDRAEEMAFHNERAQYWGIISSLSWRQVPEHIH
jgi:hypothetical protein